MGATSFGYELAQRLGLQINATRPALVPLLLNAQDRQHYCDLTGVSAEVVAATAFANLPARCASQQDHNGIHKAG
jgi:predicted flavoprotein YhiN